MPRKKKQKKTVEPLVVHVLNPAALEFEPIQQMILNACEHHPTIVGPGFVRWLHNSLHTKNHLDNPQIGFFVLRHGAEYRGFAVVEAADETTTEASLTFLHSDGTAVVRNALLDTVVLWARSWGYRQVLTMGFDEHRDGVYQRFFGQNGKRRVKQIACAYAIEVGPDILGEEVA